MRGEALKIRVFHMQEVRAGKNFRLENERLSVPTEFAYDFPDIEQLSIRILPPRCRDVQTNTIMDVYSHIDQSIGYNWQRHHAYSYGSMRGPMRRDS